jgi:hypothetical protein
MKQSLDWIASFIYGGVVSGMVRPDSAGENRSSTEESTNAMVNNLTLRNKLLLPIMGMSALSKAIMMIVGNGNVKKSHDREIEKTITK